MDSIVIILIISVLAPILGSLIGVFFLPSKTVLYHMLSFAAGVMLAISFIELIPESIRLSSLWITILGILVGALIIYIIDKLIPHDHPDIAMDKDKCDIKRTSTYLIIGIFFHNLPEGMAIAIGVVSSFKVTLSIALAIAIHNIPEGICTSAPYYFCTKNRLKSFLVSSSTALPIIVGYFLASWLYTFINPTLVGFIIAATAGLMIYISADELIPTSSQKMTNHKTIFTLILGVILVLLLKLI